MDFLNKGNTKNILNPLPTWNMFLVFLNFPCRETPKNVLKTKFKKKMSDGGWVWDLAKS
jgi:hypothetical protein